MDDKIKKRIIDSVSGDVLWEDGVFNSSYRELIFAVGDIDMPFPPTFHHIETEGPLDVSTKNPDWINHTRWAKSNKIYWFNCLYKTDNYEYYSLRSELEQLLTATNTIDKIIGAFCSKTGTLVFNESLLPPEHRTEDFEPIQININLELSIIKMMLLASPNPLPLTLNKLIKHLNRK